MSSQWEGLIHPNVFPDWVVCNQLSHCQNKNSAIHDRMAIIYEISTQIVLELHSQSNHKRDVKGIEKHQISIVKRC